MQTAQVECPSFFYHENKCSRSGKNISEPGIVWKALAWDPAIMPCRADEHPDQAGPRPFRQPPPPPPPPPLHCRWPHQRVDRRPPHTPFFHFTGCPAQGACMPPIRTAQVSTMGTDSGQPDLERSGHSQSGQNVCQVHIQDAFCTGVLWAAETCLDVAAQSVKTQPQRDWGDGKTHTLQVRSSRLT